jgi:hypothetical protein
MCDMHESMIAVGSWSFVDSSRVFDEVCDMLPPLVDLLVCLVFFLSFPPCPGLTSVFPM